MSYDRSRALCVVAYDSLTHKNPGMVVYRNSCSRLSSFVFICFASAREIVCLNTSLMGTHMQGAAKEREKAALVSQLETKLQGKISHCKSFSEILTVLCGASISGSEILSPFCCSILKQYSSQIN